MRPILPFLLVIAAAFVLWAGGAVLGFNVALLPTILMSVAATAVLMAITRATSRRR